MMLRPDLEPHYLSPLHREERTSDELMAPIVCHLKLVGHLASLIEIHKLTIVKSRAVSVVDHIKRLDTPLRFRRRLLHCELDKASVLVLRNVNSFSHALDWYTTQVIKLINRPSVFFLDVIIPLLFLPSALSLVISLPFQTFENGFDLFLQFLVYNCGVWPRELEHHVKGPDQV
jgi:hypothetical protein